MKLLIALGFIAASFMISQANAQSAELRICEQQYRSPLATYRATVYWHGSHAQADHYVLGVMGDGGILWITPTIHSISGSNDGEFVLFNIMDDMSYPFHYAVYGVTNAAFSAYQSSCKLQGQCFVTSYDGGPVALSKEAVLLDAASTDKCPG